MEPEQGFIFGGVLTQGLLFVCAAGLSWVVLDLLNGNVEKTEERLSRISDRRKKGGKGESETKKEVITRVLQKASPSLSKPLAPTNEVEAGKLRQKLSSAGFRGDSVVGIYLTIKLLATIFALAACGGISLWLHGMSKEALMKTIVGVGIGFYLPELVLSFLASKRKQSIFYGLPDALDLMVVCVEAGLGLDQALRKVADEMKKSHRVLAEEFGLSNLHLQMGRAKAQVLQELGNRNGVDDLRVLVSLLIQADKFGTSVAQALRTQSDSMRIRRQQIAEEKAAKTAVKLIFPLVIFIFPGIFVVLVGPAAIQMMNEMLPAMNGG